MFVIEYKIIIKSCSLRQLESKVGENGKALDESQKKKIVASHNMPCVLNS